MARLWSEKRIVEHAREHADRLLQLPVIRKRLRSLKRRYPVEPELLDHMIETYRRTREDIETRESLRPLPGVGEALTRLRSQRLKIVLLTKGRKSKTEKALRRAGLHKHFDMVIGERLVKKGRDPNPQALLRPLARFAQQRNMRLNPEHAIHVADTAYDIESGNQAGMHTAAVLSGMGTYGVLNRAGPTFIAKDLRELARQSNLRGQGIRVVLLDLGGVVFDTAGIVRRATEKALLAGGIHPIVARAVAKIAPPLRSRKELYGHAPVFSHFYALAKHLERRSGLNRA